MRTALGYLLVVLVMCAGLLCGGCVEDKTPLYEEIKGHVPAVGPGDARVWVFNTCLSTDTTQASPVGGDVSVSGGGSVSLPIQMLPTCGYIDRKQGDCMVTLRYQAGLSSKEEVSVKVRLAAGTTRYIWVNEEQVFGRYSKITLTKIDPVEAGWMLNQCRYVGVAVPGYPKEKP